MTKCFSRSRIKQCFLPVVPNNTSFLHVYNCENEKPPKKVTVPGEYLLILYLYCTNLQQIFICCKAEKQIFRTDYVRLHFIHYSAITSEMLLTESQLMETTHTWTKVYSEKHVRFADELTEATMIHTKTVPFEDTQNFQNICKEKRHYFGFPYPNNVFDSVNNKTEEGYYYTCYINDIVEKYWIPKLHEALGLPIPN